MKAIRGLLLYGIGWAMIAATPSVWAFGGGWQLGVCVAWALYASSVQRLLSDATHGKCRCGRKSR